MEDGAEMSGKMLTFELTKDGDQLEIHGNREGLLLLREAVGRLLRDPMKQDHCHLMTETWGGDELTDEKHIPDGRLLNSVTVFFWPK